MLQLFGVSPAEAGELSSYSQRRHGRATRVFAWRFCHENDTRGNKEEDLQDMLERTKAAAIRLHDPSPR